MRFSFITVSSLIAAAYAAPAALNDAGVNTPVDVNGAIDSVRITGNTLNTGTVNAPVNVDADGKISRVTTQVTDIEVEGLGARDVKTVVAQVKTTVTQVKTHITKIDAVVATITKTTVASKKTEALRIMANEVSLIVDIITLFLVEIRGVLTGAVKITNDEKKAIFNLVSELIKELSVIITKVFAVPEIGKSSQEPTPGFVLIARSDAFEIISNLIVIEVSFITPFVSFLNIQNPTVLALTQGIKLPVKVL